jgi:hypothetical protein
MKDCKKCGSNDIQTRYIEEGELIDSSSTCKVETEFVTSSEYDYFYQLTAKKGHLDKHCRNCQHGWLENTLDSKLDQSVKQH